MAGFTRDGARRVARATQLVEQRYGVAPSTHYRRRFPRGGGGSSLRWGQATSAISAATGWDTDDWGTGTVQLYDDAGAADGDPVDVLSAFRDAFVDNSVVCIDTKYSPARVVSVGCTVVGE